MIPQNTIEEILTLDAGEVIGRYIQLRKKGSSYQACCPFHEEKTPSFSVSSVRNMYKCFGCGKGGNHINFVMELKKLDYPSAIKEIASQHNIIIPQDQRSDEQKKEDDRVLGLYQVNEMAMEWFRLQLKENPKSLEYVTGRWKQDSIQDFKIGYAPDSWDSLKKWAGSNGIKETALLEAGLLTESKSKVFDYFRNRIIFPIMNRTGRVVGFTGRDFSGKEDVAKYFNTRETEIYKKNHTLYGIHAAWKAIKEKGYVHLVEGNPDVIRLHELGKFNTVSSGGTSLTQDQIKEIQRYTNSVTIIGDSDKAGVNASIKSGKLIVSAGLFCNMIQLPAEDGKKEDPDSFFKDGNEFDQYAKDHLIDYIFWLAENRKEKCKNPDLKSKLIDEISELISKLPANSSEIYIEQLSAIIKPKKAWQDKLKSLQAEEPVKEETGVKIPAKVLLSDWEKYGFYDDHNQYFFRTKEGIRRGCNFVMEPKFHIRSIMNAKRLFRIVNEFGYEQTIEIPQKDLISLSNFRLRLESLGNFIWEAGEPELYRLKRFLYEKTLSADEIVQLGWQKQGFWAWSNGIYNSPEFKKTDPNGIIAIDQNNYYLPSSSNIFESEEKLFSAERHIKHMPGKISLFDFSSRLIEVFGDNAIISLCFFFASIFRDHIFRPFGFFPILNFFGPKGTGKSDFAVILLQLFGPQKVGPNIVNSTLPALGDHVGLMANGFIHIDEYKNSLDPAKIEFLKGLWNGVGRNVKDMDFDKKKKESPVDCGIILTGQEMPNADIALYTRLIFLAFNRDEFSAAEKDRFSKLKELSQKGLTHLTHEVLNHRAVFVDKFIESYELVSADLLKSLDTVKVMDRIFRNWLIPLASFYTLKDLIRVPFDYARVLSLTRELLIRQNLESNNSNEIAIFWSIVEFLAKDGQIREGVDFTIELVDKLKTDTIDSDWKKAKTILFIDHTRLFPLYRIHGQKSKDNIIPLKTLEFYLKSSKEYLGKKLSKEFKTQENGRLIPDQEVSVSKNGKETVKKIRHITTAMAFEYDLLNISISNITIVEEKNNSDDNKNEPDLPF